MKSANSKPDHRTKGDIFDDLGFSAEEVLEGKIKADIWQALIRHIEARSLTQADLVTALKAHQPDVSNLLNGKISNFSVTRLIQFAGRLNLQASVKLKAAKSDSPTIPAERASRRKLRIHA
ncbi:MAG TPA: helix-turn-helix transcriptional regulator [Acidobacteriaceae bacterium]